MSEHEVEKIEKYLIPFALQRFDFDSYQTNFPMSKMAMNMAKKMMGNWLNDYVTWLVRAFTRCLLNVSDEIYLKDLGAVVAAEANYMSGIGPMGPFERQSMSQGSGNRAGTENLVETEIHVWLLHLQEENMLPGIYERFTGKYFVK
ncbi:MAG: hypothetical protein GOP50_01495 [Candidatus Heimdallarchaeota archaeon]|nr:hypothetical protein [Candidatus Heimdallarchaeota archaeon]